MRFGWVSTIAFGLAASVAILAPPAQAAAMKAAPAKPTVPRAPAPGRAPAPAQPGTAMMDTQATHAFILEAETGTVLLDKGSDERIPTASLSKVMTAYVVFDMLKHGRAKLTDELPVSEAAWRTQGSKMFVPLGGRITIEQLVQGMVVQSGNDACVVLAEGLAGSQEAFVDLMNQKAKEIALTNSHFANVDGLPSPDHYMSERDLARLALRTISDFPEYYHYYSEKEYGFNNINQGNRNPLLYKDLGADGLKTGHTEEAGYSLLASVHRGNRRVILVLNGLPSMKARAQESERLVEWAFREYNNYHLFSTGEKVDEASVWLGDAAKVPLTVGQDLDATLSRKSRKDMKVTLAYAQPVPAPIHKGDQLGKVVVSAADLAAPIEAPLLAGADVERLGALGRAAMVGAQLVWGNRH